MKPNCLGNIKDFQDEIDIGGESDNGMLGLLRKIRNL